MKCTDPLWEIHKKINTGCSIKVMSIFGTSVFWCTFTVFWAQFLGQGEFACSPRVRAGSPWMHLGTPASSHSPEACKLGELVTATR